MIASSSFDTNKYLHLTDRIKQQRVLIFIVYNIYIISIITYQNIVFKTNNNSSNNNNYYFLQHKMLERFCMGRI
jgi:hypothetical protein